MPNVAGLAAVITSHICWCVGHAGVEAWPRPIRCREDQLSQDGQSEADILALPYPPFGNCEHLAAT